MRNRVTKSISSGVRMTCMLFLQLASCVTLDSRFNFSELVSSAVNWGYSKTYDLWSLGRLSEMQCEELVQCLLQSEDANAAITVISNTNQRA